ncbi:MAG: hypothetical protein M5U28_10330 [Sandaracinaceae bacterium]|nr:hypothetical protein [Sandaracinaceae bacterium]
MQRAGEAASTLARVDGGPTHSTMRRARRSWVSLLVFVCGCGAAQPSRGGGARHHRLREPGRGPAQRGGADVRMGGRVMPPYMPVAARLLAVDGAHVQVFELPDEASARTLAARIAPDASRVGRATIVWTEPPHFFAAGRAIVLYVGQDESVLARLEEVLGEPIAIGHAAKREPQDEDDWVPTTRA